MEPKITAERGVKQIDQAIWTKDSYGWLELTVLNSQEQEVKAQLSLRPVYCDRGHIQLLMDGHIELDGHDMFPRFFFSFEEADHHVRSFLKWKLWKTRVYPHQLDPVGPIESHLNRIEQTCRQGLATIDNLPARKAFEDLIVRIRGSL